MKKEWTKPKLVVLFRARADENVLGFCKAINDLTGPTTDFSSCNFQDPPGLSCNDIYCEEGVAS